VTLGEGGHDIAISGEALAVEGGLNQPALAQPGVALGEEEAVTDQGAQPAQAEALGEVPVPRHEELFDGVRVVDQEHADGTQPRLDEVAVFPRARLVEAELIALEVGRASEEEAPLRSLEEGLHLVKIDCSISRRCCQTPHEMSNWGHAGRLRKLTC